MPFEALAGKFIVFDGPDGCGKSTQIANTAAHLRNRGLPVCCVREPGGTRVGEQIRHILLSPEHGDEIDSRCELLLFMASRVQLYNQVIRPALERKEVVLADRYISSTYAYQGYPAGTLGWIVIEEVKAASGLPAADLTIILDAERRKLEVDQDRIERKDQDYRDKVRRNYLKQVERWPDAYALIDGGRAPEPVFADVIKALEHFSTTLSLGNS